MNSSSSTESTGPGLIDGDPFDQLEDWLAIDSTTGREKSYLQHLERLFDSLGYRTDRQPVADERWNLVALPDNLDHSDPGLLFCTHVDTVPPHLEVRRNNEAIFGRGACDTKGGQWAMLQAAERLRRAGLDDLGFLLVVGEEVDHCGARAARGLDLSPERILLCEPTKNRLVTGQKGMVKIDLTATGVAGHSAFPESGDSAIHRLLTFLETLRGRDWPADRSLGETTLNVGIIDGGTAANVLAPTARAEVLFRTVSPASDIIESVESIADGLVDDVEPVSFNDPVRFDIPEDLLREADTCVVPFNTDAPYLTDLGPVWLTGPGDIKVAHSDDEHITRDSLIEGVDLYERLGRHVLDRSH